MLKSDEDQMERKMQRIKKKLLTKINYLIILSVADSRLPFGGGDDKLEERNMEKVYTKNAPEAIGPYSQAVKAGGLLFTSGQIPLIPETGELAQGDIAAQAEQSCKNVAAILEAAGCKLTDVVKTTCFLADMADFPRFNEVYGKYFTEKPARSCVAVKTLPKNVLCEVEAIAEVK